MSRTAEEIKAKVESYLAYDVFGFAAGDLIAALSFEDAAPYIRAGMTHEEWDAAGQRDKSIDAEAKEYMGFWLEKIANERGLSVHRGTMHYEVWKWLLGHPDAETFPGATRGGDGGYYQRDAYNYIKAQMDCGVWDRMTEEANKPKAPEEAAGV